METAKLPTKNELLVLRKKLKDPLWDVDDLTTNQLRWLYQKICVDTGDERGNMVLVIPHDDGPVKIKDMPTESELCRLRHDGKI